MDNLFRGLAVQPAPAAAEAPAPAAANPSNDLVNDSPPALPAPAAAPAGAPAAEGENEFANLNAVEAPAAQEQPVQPNESLPSANNFEQAPIETYLAENPVIPAAQARKLAQSLIHNYFTSQLNPLTKHHLDSYDQFMLRDMRAIIKSQNPLLIYKNPKGIENPDGYMYRAQLWVGGESGDEISFGSPALQLKNGKDVRMLFPNEARLRNLTYATQIHVKILVKVEIQLPPTEEDKKESRPYHLFKWEESFDHTLCSFPLMLHSTNCVLNGKSNALLTQMGECAQDQGGYFIIDGSEKVLVTRQEGAFNTLWIKEQKADENVQYYASISSLNAETRDVRRVSFYWTREKTIKNPFTGDMEIKESVLEVQIPYVMKPVPVFLLFRALGLRSDKEILQLIFPDFQSPEARQFADLLRPSMIAAAPFYDTYSSLEYIKSLTKGFSMYHVLDILHNQFLPHVLDEPGARAAYLADCVRQMLKVVAKAEMPYSRDDVRYQRCLTSGFLCQMLFQNVYSKWLTGVRTRIGEKYAYNQSAFSNEAFVEIFNPSSHHEIFLEGYMTEQILRGFKGKWMTGLNKEEPGVIQELSRLSYLDFISHLRHSILDFDTSMKLTGPRQLHPSQYGYFCTSETPSGASIGITKNLTIMTAISTGMLPKPLIKWLYSRGFVVPCNMMTPQLLGRTVPVTLEGGEALARMVPVYVNSGIVGYTRQPILLARVLKLLKRTGCLPPYSSSGFSIPERRIFIFVDEGRPVRPLIGFHTKGKFPSPALFKGSWRELVIGSLDTTKDVRLNSKVFIDPLESNERASYEEYITLLEDKQGVIEYIDSNEQNEALIANVPEHILPDQTTHMEVHPSTILGLLGNCIPYPNHNQSPRNQLSASQSKQALSIYATNWNNRFDNTANVLCYGQAPICRTIYQDYFGSGKLPYGQNVILAMGMYGGYNQEDGIIMNADALARGQFRSLNYRSYEAREEKDDLARVTYKIGNPRAVDRWMDLKPNLDYTHLDEDGIIKVGTYVTQTTVICGRYMETEQGLISDASVTPQVWTRGRVEKVVVTVDNNGMRLVKIRVVQDRVPELGDKFSNRHGQKGTLNIMYRSYDMPRTADGITPDMIMNPTAIPSRMTIGQILEMLLGNVAAHLGAIGNCTAFMNDGSPHELFGQILEKLGLNKMSNQVLYNGMTGEQMTADIYMGVVYGMRLKHMTEDKWNARGEGRKEMRTHQPTGGRGNEGGLKIGEMDRDAILAHSVSSFLQESMMQRSDGTSFIVCNGCGTFPLYNQKENLYICPMCDGPIQFSGSTVNTLDPIPPPVRSAVTFSKIEIPYATKLLIQEEETFANLSMRLLTTHDVAKLRGLESLQEYTQEQLNSLKSQPLTRIQFKEREEIKPAEPVAAPTQAQIDAKLAELLGSSEGTDTGAAAAVPAPAPAIAPQLPANAAALQASVNGQAVREAQAGALGIPLAPGSFAPAPLPAALAPAPATASPAPVWDPFGNLPPAPAPAPAPGAQQGGGTTILPPTLQPVQGIMMTTTDGTPVLNIDTSEPALHAAGLYQPNEQPPLQPLFPAAPPARSRSRSRSPSNYRDQLAASFPQPAAAPQQDPSAAPAAPSAPVTVIKMG